jgi:PGF-pre-PGF domain-containing protein
MNNVFYSSFGSSVWSNTVTPLQNVTFSNNHFYDNFSVNDVIFRTNYPYDVIFYNNSFYDSSVNLTKNIFGDNLMGTFCHNGIGNYYYDGAWGKYCPPTISLNSPSNNFNSPNSEINFSITVSDQNDDYLDCNVSLNGTAIVNFSANIQGQTSTFKNISDGIYLWNISCINENSDNVISETRNLEIDSFPPKVPNVTSISQSGNIATLEWNPIVKNVIGESEVDNIIYQIWYGTSINMSKDNISETLTFLKDVNSNTTTYSVTSTDRYYFVITTKDVTGNQNLSFGNGTLINVSLTYTAPVTPPSNDDSGDSGSSGSSGSSSSGGGSSGYVAPPKIEDEKVFIEIKLKVKANESVNFSVKKPEISIKEIKIVSKEDKSKISIKVSKKDEIKIKVKPKNSFAIYEYLEITPELIEDDEIGNATINFEINTTWLEENRFSKNKVMLLRNHNDTWQELVTHLLSEADGLVHYEAITPGFSEFAIAANLEEEKTIILDDIATEIIEEPKEEEKLITETNHKNYWLYGGIGLTIIGIIVTLFIFNKKDFEK